MALADSVHHVVITGSLFCICDLFPFPSVPTSLSLYMCRAKQALLPPPAPTFPVPYSSPLLLPLLETGKPSGPSDFGLGAESA